MEKQTEGNRPRKVVELISIASLFRGNHGASKKYGEGILIKDWKK